MRLREEIRADVRASRARRGKQLRATDDAARAARCLSLVESLVAPADTVACYLSIAPEPDTLDLVDDLATRYDVIVPALELGAGPRWAHYLGREDLVAGSFSIPMPSGGHLDADALHDARFIIAAALAADGAGGRLGTGGGWYDRALTHRSPGTEVAVLLNDDEIRPIPLEAHDVPVEWIVTPTRTIHCHDNDARHRLWHFWATSANPSTIPLGRPTES